MKSLFTNWSKLSKHTGAMLMVPSLLAICVVTVLYFSWNREMIEDSALLDKAMEVRIGLEHSRLTLHQLDKALLLLRDTESDEEKLENRHERVTHSVDRLVQALHALNRDILLSEQGSATLGSVLLSEVHVSKSSDEELNQRIAALKISVARLSESLIQALQGDGYQSFINKPEYDAMFAEAANHARFNDERVHAMIKEKLDNQRRFFLLIILLFTLLAVLLFVKWRQLHCAQEDCLADIYLGAEATAQSVDALLIASVDGLIEYTNPAFAEYAGYKNGELAGKPLLGLAAEADTLWLDQLLKQVTANAPWSGEITYLDKQQQNVQAVVTVSPIQDRSHTSSFFVMRFH